MTPEQLLQICPKCRAAQEVSDALNEAFAQGGITEPSHQAAFVAQCAHESAQFNVLEENLNYSAKGLAGTWPNRYADKKDADGDGNTKEPNALALRLERNPEAIANNCYADRMGNGDEASGDGWRYRGRGWKMVTGRANYAACAAATGLDCVNNPDVLATADGAARSAVWFWTANNCASVATNCRALTKKINGGDIGLAEREALTNKALQVLT